ncbi:MULTISPECIES: UbiA family prenyltransferase [unclassified Acidovorax]|uniref:UbiA family prenyltransferase n=1 Tax=unclassified Acidovorax TaxID=2684926 RepID=UPI00288325BA|nr:MULTISPECIES: UbiA family prenyltransferase [unclassified Acidovorax]
MNASSGHALPVDNAIPLIVDLDGTLILTDMLHESSLQLARTSPWLLLQAPLWLAKGKASFKKEISDRTSINPASLPYNQPLLAWLREQKAQGRTLVLCTASHSAIANSIAGHLGLFDHVMASDGALNLSGSHKADSLVKIFGMQGFDYAGNASVDMAVWKVARQAIVVNASNAVVAKAKALGNVTQVLPAATSQSRILLWLRATRVHQWLKNMLLFVPLLAAHELQNVDAIFTLVLAFLAWGLCASSVYIANDLLDLESDREHPRKRRRPFATGLLPSSHGVLAVPVLAGLSLYLAALVGGPFLAWMLVYLALTWAYSLSLKRIALLDCVTLAFLYTLRIVAGSMAADLPTSFWLLACSAFLFLSLAFVKRYAELLVQRDAGKTQAHGRGYLTSDASMVQSLGVAAAYTAVVVLALYLNSATVLLMYDTPELVWATVPILCFWVSRMWLCAARGEMHDDPLVFAFKDRVSLVAGGLFCAVLLAASARYPW